MDSFTQNLINRTKQRQAMLAKTKTGTIGPVTSSGSIEKMSGVDLDHKENVPTKTSSSNNLQGTSSNLGEAAIIKSPMRVVGSIPKVSVPTKTPSSNNLQATSGNLVEEVHLEKPILKSLETQGFTPSNSRSRLIYQFAKEQAERDEEDAANPWASKHKYSQRDSPKKTNLNKDLKRDEKTSSPSRVITSNTSSSILRANQFITPKKTFTPSKQYSPSSANKSPNRFQDTAPAKTLSPSAVLSKTANLPKGQTTGKQYSPSAGSKTLDRPKIATPSRQYSASALGVKTPERSQNSISNRIAQFESRGPPKKDPCEMSLSDRKKFFESSAQQATPSKLYFTPKLKPTESKILSDKLSQEKPSQVNLLSASSTPATIKGSLAQTADTASSTPSIEERPVQSTKKFFSPVKTNIEISSEPLPIQAAVEEAKPIPSITVTPEVRPIRVSPPKPGRLYPCLSDIEASTTESESDYVEDEHSTLVEDKEDAKETSRDSLDLDSSFAVDILGKAGLMEFVNTPKRKYPAPQPPAHEHNFTSSLDFKKLAPVSEADCLQSSKKESNTEGLSASKYSKKEEEKEALHNETEPRLFHSISFYRKQQQDLIATPKKETTQTSETETKRSAHHKAIANSATPIEQMIKSLEEEIKAQEVVMAQASQALNFCRSTAEFSGSTEQVEGEKLLLIATQKRNAACSEISRLKAQSNVNTDSELPISHGNLSISDVKLPLKKEFINLLSKGGDDFVHYFILMIRHQGQVIPLQMLSTLDGVTDGALRFPNLIQLRDLPPSFQLTIEVYALQTRKEKLDHQAKYHIKKETNKLRLTPRKSESRLHSRVPKTNPHQTSALRNSSFGLVGFCQISQSTLKQNMYTLEKMPAASPILGQLHVKIQCHADVCVDERGFLTVFEDVGGYGAWHRRWCLLSNDELLFWKYPDEEKRKTPMAHINLRKCVTEKVDVVPHDVCARPHTFLLVTARPPKDGDKDSLVMSTSSQQTLIKNLLSADTKEERIRWCSLLNRILSNLRTWDVGSSN